MKPVRVLILDGNSRPALAAARSLGKKGFEVMSADEQLKTLCSVSKYCKGKFVYPSPFRSGDEFIKVVHRECVNREVDVLLPMTEITTYLVLKERTRIRPSYQIPFPDFPSFDIVSDKIKLLRLAQEMDIPIPRTHFIDKPEDVHNLRGELKFPLVLKPGRSRILSRKGWITAGVRYANNFDQLEKICSEEKAFQEVSFVLQEYIKGYGCGIFLLYDRGNPLTYFAHRRLREKPPSGGVSVLCESIDVNPLMRKYAESLLSEIGWHGVAMVEFKRCLTTGIPYLMEINGRFWGSLQLAINAGVDFPYLLCKLAMGEEVQAPRTYRAGIKSRWLLGDLDSLYLTLFSKGLSPFKLSISDKLKTVYQFFKPFQRNTRFEVMSMKDPKPFLFELGQYVGIFS